MSIDLSFSGTQIVTAGGRQEFDAINFSVDQTLPSPLNIPIFDIGIADAGFRLGPTIDFDAQFGLPIGVELDIGAVDVGLDVDFANDIPARNNPFSGVTLDLSDFTATTSINAPGINLASSSVDLGVDVEIDSSVVFDARFTADVDGTGRDPDINIGTQIPLFDLPDINIDATLLEFTGSDLSGNFREAFWDIGTRFGDAVPDAASASADDSLVGASAGGTLEPVLGGRINLAAAIASIFAVPPEFFEDTLSFGLGSFLDVEASYTTFATDLRFEALLLQDYNFTPNAIEVVLTAEDGQRREGFLGDEFEFDVPEGTGTLGVTAEYNLVGDLVSEFALDLEAFFEITLLFLEVNGFVDIEFDPPGTGRSPDIDIERSFGFDIGPLFESSSELPSLAPISLGGSTQSVSLAPVVVEYEIPYERFFSASAADDNITLTGGQSAINAGDGNDTIIGNLLGNNIDGGNGDDVLSSPGGRDTILGGDGADDIRGDNVAIPPGVLGFATHADLLNGGAGSDLIIGGNGGDRIFGGEGDDTIFGGDAGASDNSGDFGSQSGLPAGSSDTVDGGPGDDFIDGEAFNDNLDGGEGNDTILGGTGEDFIRGMAGDDSLDGGPGDDTVGGDQQGGFVAIEEGDDILSGGTGADLVLGGPGDDRIRLDVLENDTLRGGPGFDVLDLTNAPVGLDLVNVGGLQGGPTVFVTLEGFEAVEGSAFDDRLQNFELAEGRGGNDFLSGAFATLDGGEGDDEIFLSVSGIAIGGAGNDDISGFRNGALIRPGSGNDIVTASAGSVPVGAAPNRFVYESGDDRYTGSLGDDILDLSELTEGVTFRLGFNGVQTVPGGSIDARGFEELIGTEFDDVLTTVGAGPGRLEGGGGNDVLTARAPGTTLMGGAGEDTYQGGFGVDVFESWGDGAVDRITGSGGADIFRVTSLPTARDIITDFQLGFDEFDLSAILTPQSVVSTRATAEGLELVVTEPGSTTVIALLEGVSDPLFAASAVAALPLASLSAAGETVQEGDSLFVTVTLDAPAPPGGVTLDLLIERGDADPERRSVIIGEGERDTVVEIATSDTPGVGLDEAVTVSILPSPGVFVPDDAEPLAATVLDDDPVQAVADAIATPAGAPQRFDPRLNDTGRLGEALNIVELAGESVEPGDTVSLPSGATITLLPTGELLYDPGAVLGTLTDGETAPDTFTYRIEGGRGGVSTPAEVLITVIGGAQPALSDDVLSVSEDAMNALLDIGANDGVPGTPVRLGEEVITPGTPVEGTSGETFRLDNGLRFDSNGAFNALPAGASQTVAFSYQIALPSGLGASGKLDAFDDTTPLAAPGVAGTGQEVTALGDLNGDGLNDLLIQGDGESFVVFGANGLEGIPDLTEPGAALRLTGSIAAAAGGDVGGDGISDLVFTQIESQDVATATILFGATDLPQTLDLDALGDRGLDLGPLGPGPFGLAGSPAPVASGDVDGDGTDDIVLGAGSTGDLTLILGGMDRTTIGATRTTIDTTALSGGLLGDINDDNREDIFAAAAGVPGSSAVGSVIFGSDTPSAVLDGTTGFSIIDTGAAVSLPFVPWTITGLGDVSGDGIGDFGVVSPDGSRAAVVFGRADPVPGGVIDLAALDGTDGFRLTAAGADFSLEAAGDLNADGINDIAVGVLRQSTLNSVAVVFGSTDTGATLDIATLDGQTGFTIDETPFAGVARGIGPALAGVGDVTGDGIDDLAIGAEPDRRALLLEGLATPPPRPDAAPEDLGEGDLSPSAQVILQVLGENDAPIAQPDAFTAQSGTPFEIALTDLLANDDDPDDGDIVSVLRIGDTQIVPGARVPLPGGAELVVEDGVLRLVENGAFDSLPLGGDTEFDLPVTVTDTAGALDETTLTLTVRAQNRPPVAVDDAAQLLFLDFGIFEGVEIDVLANDSDPEGGPLRIQSFTDGAFGDVSLIFGATPDPTDDRLIYTSIDPTPGVDVFTYIVVDEDGGTAQAQVTVDRRFDAPELVAVADAFEVSEDDGTRTLGNLLDNDTADPNLPLVVSAVTLPDGTIVELGESTALAGGGQLTVTADGVVSFDPAGAFEALPANPMPEPAAELIEFSYSVFDGFSIATGTAQIGIRGANDLPTAVDDTAETAAGAAVTISVLDNDTDIDGDTLAVASATDGDNGTTTVGDDGTITYTPERGFSGIDTFTYVVDDGAEGTATATVSVTVNEPIADSHIEFDTAKLALAAGGKPFFLQAALHLGGLNGTDNLEYTNAGTKRIDDDRFGGVDEGGTLIASELFQRRGGGRLSDPQLEPGDLKDGVQDIGGFKTREGEGLNPLLTDVVNIEAFKIRQDATEAPEAFILNGGDGTAPDGSQTVLKGGQGIRAQDSGFGVEFGIDRNGAGKPEFSGDGGPTKAIAGPELLLFTLADGLLGTGISFGVDRASRGSAEVALDFYRIDRATGLYERIGERVVVEQEEGAPTGPGSPLADLGFGFDAVAVSSADGGRFRLEALEIGTVRPEGSPFADDTPGEVVVLQPGETLSGTPEELNDIKVVGFNETTTLTVESEDFDRDQLTIAPGSTVLEVDLDRDGTSDITTTLLGDFSDGDFIVFGDGTDTDIGFAHFLPDLMDRAARADDEINGVVNQAFLTGDGTTNFKVQLQDLGFAAFQNTLGVYEITPTGEITDARILFENTRDARSDPSTAEAIINGVEAGNTLGFFLVQNGNRVDPGVFDADTLSFVTGGGAAGSAFGDEALFLEADGQRSAATVFHSFNADLNVDGLQHVLSGAAGDNNALVFGFEDLTGNGDRDFEDVVFSIERIDDVLLG